MKRREALKSAKEDIVAMLVLWFVLITIMFLRYVWEWWLEWTL
ncbi:hypothetical protein PK35_gp32 [Geobacillus phage vB_GthS_PK3.5]|nr:hypothetical protein PK35_gp32 [Geobacillus phage vB_GthS_PK3.5]UYL94267.1 hypothetical protein PT91_gp32 [Geobacillus phage vB_GthS_PT9.1]